MSSLEVWVSESWAERGERERTSWTYWRRWRERASYFLHFLSIHSTAVHCTAWGHSHTRCPLWQSPSSYLESNPQASGPGAAHCLYHRTVAADTMTIPPHSPRCPPRPVPSSSAPSFRHSNCSSRFDRPAPHIPLVTVFTSQCAFKSKNPAYKTYHYLHKHYLSVHGICLRR